MPNTIAPVVTYIPSVIDKVNSEEALSLLLNAPADKVKAGLDNSSEVKIKKFTFGGAGTYDGTIPSNAGFTQAWETRSLSVKRATKLPLELIEGIEGQLATSDMISEFQRVKMVPERDAVVFSKTYIGADATTKTTGTLDNTSIKGAIDTGTKVLNKKEAPKEGRILFISSDGYDALSNATGFSYNLDAEKKGNIDTRVGMYNNMVVIEVPPSRFNTAVTLSATDGYTLTGTDINFLIVSKGAVQVYDKITKGEIVLSSSNADSFEDVYKYLAYYDAIIWDNQAVNIYAHAKAAVTTTTTSAA